MEFINFDGVFLVICCFSEYGVILEVRLNPKVGVLLKFSLFFPLYYEYQVLQEAIFVFSVLE